MGHNGSKEAAAVEGVPAAEVAAAPKKSLSWRLSRMHLLEPGWPPRKEKESMFPELALPSGLPPRREMPPRERFAIALEAQTAEEASLLRSGFERVAAAYGNGGHGHGGGAVWTADTFARGFLSEVDPARAIPTALAPLLFRACSLGVAAPPAHSSASPDLLDTDAFVMAMAVVRHGGEAELLALCHAGVRRETPGATFNALSRALTLAGVSPSAPVLLDSWLRQALPR